MDFDQIRILHRKIHQLKERKNILFYMTLNDNNTHIYMPQYFGEYVTPWTVHIFGKIADTTKANIYFIPSFRQYKLPTFSRGRF